MQEPRELTSARPSDEPALARKGRSARRNLWLGILLFAIIVVGAAFAGFWIVVLQPKSAEPYRMALKLVQKDPQVQKALGEPIQEAAWWLPPSGTLDVQNGQGRASYTFDIKGPDGMAYVRTEARCIDGQWGLTTLDVTIATTNKRIVIDTSSSGPGEEAPRWKK